MVHRFVALLVVLLATAAFATTASAACLDNCNQDRTTCTASCDGDTGAARAACLRICTKELTQCKATCASTPSPKPPATPAPKPAPKPAPTPTPTTPRRSPSPKPSSGPRDPTCSKRCADTRSDCSAGCSDLVGAARGRCLVTCSKELQACINACPPAPPPPRGSVEVELAWDRLRCFDDGEKGSAQPYLWTVFFKIDSTNTDIIGTKLKVKPGASLATLADSGGHGNLPKIRSGQTKAVSTSFRFRPLLRPFTPFTGVKAAIVGSISVLLEEDGVSDSGAKAGARKFRDEVDKLLKSTVDTLTLTGGVVLPNLNAGIKTIQNAVVKAIKNEQSFFQNLGTFLGSPDDFLGSQIVIASVADNVPGGIAGTIAIPVSTAATVAIDGDVMDKGSDGRWQLLGHVRRLQNN